MMLKSKYLYACLVTGLLLSIPLIAEARLGANGVSLNGTRYQGTALNTNQITPADTNGTVRVEGGQLVIQTAPISQ